MFKIFFFSSIRINCTDKNIVDKSYYLVKYFLDFPLSEYRIAGSNQNALLVLSNSVFPEREIQTMFY